MPKEYIQPAIPITQNCVIALSLDIPKGQEHVIIGELKEVQRYLPGIKEANILAEGKRPLGSFLADCFHHMAGEMADLRIVLCDALDKEKPFSFEEGLSFLEELYRSENYCHKYLSVRLWQDYHNTCSVNNKRLKNAEDKKYIEKFIDRIEDLTLPFRFSIENDISKWQSDHPQYPMHYFDEEYYRHLCGLIFAGDKKTSEYAFADVSLMPLLLYALHKYYDNHLYFQRCKLCARLFLANTANIPSFCSKECKREQARLNKQKFDSKAKQLPYEKSYKATYMYWYNKVKKIRGNTTISPIFQTSIENAFSDFCSEAIARKSAVKNRKIKEIEYENWLLLQRDMIDKILDNYLNNK